MQRLLAEPYSMGTEPAPWYPPAVLPEKGPLRLACLELEGALAPATAQHMRWCINKLFALPSRADALEATAFLTENYLEVCGHLPADLWTEATRELLRTKKFRPVPSEFLAIAEPLFRQRRLMLERARSMLTGSAPKLTQEIPADFIRTERMRRLGDAAILRKHGRHGTAAKWERELAQMEGRPVEDIPEVPPTEVPVQREPGPPPLPQSDRVKALLLQGRIDFWKKHKQTEELVAKLEKQLNELLGGPP